MTAFSFRPEDRPPSVAAPALPDVLREVAGRLGGQRRTAADLVTDTLRRAILSGELPGGSPLALADVAGALDVSTTPVREALRALASDGLVRLDAYRGGIVRSLERFEIEEVVRIRHLLEPTAVRESIEGLDDALLEEAEAWLQRMLDDPDASSWMEWNRQFHDTLYRGAASRRLIELLESLQNPVAMYVGAAVHRREGFRQEANRQHVALLQAMRERDAERAIALTLDHVALPIQATEG